jgi:hypothetical protein
MIFCTGAGLRVVHNPVMDLSVLSGIAFQRETPTGEARRDTMTI